MRPTFLILHLSDAHIGNPRHALDSFEMFQALFDDLRHKRDAFTRAPDLIIFSGDLAFGEVPTAPISSQYDSAKQWLDAVYQAIGSSPAESPILFVPGNHDVNRHSVTPDQTVWLRQTMTDETLYKLMNSNDLQWQRYLERQSEWATFVQSYPCRAFRLDPRLNSPSGVIGLDSLRIGVFGMNTAWASCDEHDNGQLWLGRYQLQAATSALNDCDFKVLVSHHPVDWLQHSERSPINSKIEAVAHLYLHGHTHNQWYLDTAGHLRVSAGAAYEKSTKPAGYSWLEIDFVQRKAHLHLRRYEPEGAGGWVARHIPGKTDASGIATLSSLFDGKGRSIRQWAATSSSGPSTMYNNIAGSEKQWGEARLPTLIPEYVQALENQFRFRWEPGGYNATRQAKTIVYWPVRLRKPTAIHAVQAYAAAGLKRLGADVVLCLDDLGNAEYGVEAFSDRVSRWFTHVGEEPILRIESFSRLITSDRYRSAWVLLQSWLSDARYVLKDIFAISKMLPADIDLDGVTSLLSRKPKRLLTPALVWTCLLQILDEYTDSSQFVTLGGYDECALWSAWRACNRRTTPVGHLYNPELTMPGGVLDRRLVHMARRDSNLAWESREDIRSSLRDASADEQWQDDSRLIPWLLVGAVQLPRYLSALPMDVVIKGNAVRRVAEINPGDKSALLSTIEAEVSRYFF